MTAEASRLLALAGLAALGALLLWPPDLAGLLGTAPLLAVLAAGLAALTRWADVAALLMLPYFSYGVMEAITSPAGRGRAVLHSLLAIVVFLAALDFMRRRRAPNARMGS